MQSQKDLTNKIIDEAMGHILSGVNDGSVLQVLMGRYKNLRIRELKDLLDIANEDAMNYMNDMHNYSRYTDYSRYNDEDYGRQYESDSRL
jgi:hypothetical protein